MAEVTSKDGTWTFDGEVLRIVPAHGRGVHKLRQAVGEVAVPLQALAGVTYEPGRKGGRLRLRMREGADPFTQVTSGKLQDKADPYQLAVGSDRTGAAEFFADDVRNWLLIEQIPSGPADRYLMPGPSVPLTASAGDGSVSFDGEHISFDWNDWAEDGKKKAGPQHLALRDVARVEWQPLVGFNDGFLRFRAKGGPTNLAPKVDPYCIKWGLVREGGTSSLLAAAVVARLPHPSAPQQPLAIEEAEPPPSVDGAGDTADHDVMLRRLRELSSLHRDGVLSDEEFAVAKQAILRRL